MKFISTYVEEKISKKEKYFLCGDATTAILGTDKQNEKSQAEMPDDYIVQPDMYVNSPLPKLITKGAKLFVGIDTDIASKFHSHKGVYVSQYAIADWCRRNLIKNTLMYGLFPGDDNNVYVQIYRYRVIGASLVDVLKKSPGQILDRVVLCTYQEKVLSKFQVANDITTWLKGAHAVEGDDIAVCGDTSSIPGLASNKDVTDYGVEPFEKAARVPLNLVAESDTKQFILPVVSTLAMAGLFGLFYQQNILAFEDEKTNYSKEISGISDVYHNRSVSIKLLQDRQYYLESLQNNHVTHSGYVKQLLKAIPVLQRELKGVNPALVELRYSKKKESGSSTGDFNFMLTVSVRLKNESDKNAVVDAVVSSVSNALGVDIRSSGRPRVSGQDGQKSLYIPLIGTLGV